MRELGENPVPFLQYIHFNIGAKKDNLINSQSHIWEQFYHIDYQCST